MTQAQVCSLVSSKFPRPKVSRILAAIRLVNDKLSMVWLIENIAELFAITWPQVWKRPASDNKDAIRQLIKRGPAELPGPNSKLDNAVALQTRDLDYATKRAKAPVKKAMARRRRFLGRELKEARDESLPEEAHSSRYEKRVKKIHPKKRVARPTA